jgi:hypothetical protein
LQFQSLAGSLTVESNDLLSSLEGLDNIVSIGSFVRIVANKALLNLNALSDLTTISSELIIENNASLTTLSGLGALNSLGSNLSIVNNITLAELNGLTSLQTIPGNFTVRGNSLLTSLEGLNSLTAIEGASLQIRNNPLLSTCAIEGVCNFLDNSSATISISDNATGCATTTEVETACIDLPVSLINFSVAAEGSLVRLTWTTTMETNSDYFQIERSPDAINWKNLGIVSAVGESHSLKHYSFIDTTPDHGKNYYRLHMADTDGSFTRSPIQLIDSAPSKGFLLYPNPAAERLVLTGYGRVQKVTFYAQTGKRILEHLAPNQEEIDIRSLPAGLYLVAITESNGRVRTYRIAKE